MRFREVESIPKACRSVSTGLSAQLSQMPGVLSSSREGSLVGGIKELLLWLFMTGRSWVQQFK